MNIKFKIGGIIPLGITGNNNDMPNKEYLEFNLKRLKNQTMPVKIVIAMDENLQPDRIKIICKYADDIVYFPKDSYFRPGGIWKKIWVCWKEKLQDVEYIFQNGYDDYSFLNRFELQYKKIIETQSNSCFSSNYLMKNNIENFVNDGNINFVNYIGTHPMFMGSFLIRKNAIMNSGIEQYIDKWSYYFEGLLFAFIMKTGIPCVETNAKFYYREHSGTISSTCKEKEKYVQQAIKNVGYTFQQCKQDWDSINFNSICEEIKKKYL
jgi:hypothetical protein